MSTIRKSFARKPPTRKSQDTVLIVCEGSVTEPTYFEDMILDLGLSGTDVKICGSECGTDPMSVVKYAVQELKQSTRGFDFVYCVIDKDSHDNFPEAIAFERNFRSSKTKKLAIIWSDPCFEYWVMLHFGYSAKPYVKQGSSSRCTACIKDLGRMSDANATLGDYKKNKKGIYKLLKQRYQQAKLNAEKRKTECDAQDATNPSTLVHELCEKLISVSISSKPSATNLS